MVDQIHSHLSMTFHNVNKFQIGDIKYLNGCNQFSREIIFINGDGVQVRFTVFNKNATGLCEIFPNSPS